MAVIHAGLFIGLVMAVYAAVYWYKVWRQGLDGFSAATLRADSTQAIADAMHDLYERESMRVTRLIQQNQRLAQQLATLRVRHTAEPDELDVAPDPPEPYDRELEEFLSRIENVEALDILEQQIEDMREGGLSDTEILARISNGD